MPDKRTKLKHSENFRIGLGSIFNQEILLTSLLKSLPHFFIRTAQDAVLVQVRGFFLAQDRMGACRWLEAGNPPTSRPKGNRQLTPRRFRAEGQALRYQAFTQSLLMLLLLK